MENKAKKVKIITIITFALCLLCVCLALFTGCDNKTARENGGYDRFKVVEYEEADIYIDKETRVMYLWVSPNLDQGGLTIMVDKNGNPLLWEGEL